MRPFTAAKLKRGSPVLLLLLIGLIAASCGGQSQSSSSSPQDTPSQSMTQVDQGQGGVTVEATWVTPDHVEQMPKDALQDYLTQGAVLVHLKLDTHSGDLAQYALMRFATLTGQTGGVGATAWVSIEESSHHRDGVLVFPGWSNERWASAQRKAELALTGIGGVAERVFRWTF